MKYFLDTEFHEYKKDGIDTIELISIGIVAADGREYYAVSSDFDAGAAWGNVWLRQNVLPSIATEGTKPRFLIAAEVREFFGAEPWANPTPPEIYGYYADYDWVVFCWLFGRMIDLPKVFPMYCRDLKQMLDDYISATWQAVSLSTWGHNGLTLDQIKAHPDYPKQTNEHNALADARWNMALYDFLVSKQ